MITRRRFLEGTAAGAAISTLPAGCGSLCAAKAKYPAYENTLRDRMWMWGHDAGTTKGLYNLPADKGNILPAAAIDYMGIPNVCIIRWRGMPRPPFSEYVKQFAKTKRLVWSIDDGAPEPFADKKRMALELADKMPNLVGLNMDDFFSGNGSPKPGEQESRTRTAGLTVSTLKTLRAELAARPRHLDLSLVLYSYQLHPSIIHHIDCCDDVYFWTWDAAHLLKLQQNFETYQRIAPGKRTLLGIYMWDFGGKKPIPIELMEHQCRLGLQWMREGKIEGMIFHCTPLCDMNLEAVEWSRKWIDRHADDVVRS